MKRRGATTIWEHWTGGSHCHPMFGGTARHLITSILGITQAPGSAGYEKIVIAPQIPAALHAAEGSFRTVWGVIGTAWQRTDGGIRLTVTLPADCTGTLIWRGETYPLQGGTSETILA